MIANVNDKPVVNATCANCHNGLESMTFETNKGKQTIYVCQNENCKSRYLLTVAYFPPADTTTAKAE